MAASGLKVRNAFYFLTYIFSSQMKPFFLVPNILAPDLLAELLII